MWCAARHCAFESHPLRQKPLTNVSGFYFRHIPLKFGFISIFILHRNGFCCIIMGIDANYLLIETEGAAYF